MNSPILLALVAAGGAWMSWYFARQLYTAARYGYILTGAPEVRVYRPDKPTLFWANVLLTVAVFPLVLLGTAVLFSRVWESVAR